MRHGQYLFCTLTHAGADPTLDANKAHTGDFSVIGHYMTHHIALFRFRLSASQSIGPSALKKIWSSACGSDDVNVCRVTSGLGHGDSGRSYSLWGPPSTANLWAVETRLRQLLGKTFPSAAINLTTL